jgi:hypothetical protein
MNVIPAVASGAIRAEFLAGDDRRMADVAVQLLVRSAQFELAIARVIETRRGPRACGMALLAGRTEAGGVRIVAAVATRAIPGPTSWRAS